MSAAPPRRGFAARPRDPESWIKAAESAAPHVPDATTYTARLTIDVTPDQRGRIKIIAFQRGITVADMLRDLLAREYPEVTGDAP
jgi:hypothetical protein